MKPHTNNCQPAETRGKKVIYITDEVYDGKGKTVGPMRLHMPMPADELNWKRRGEKCATIGAINSYRILK